MTITAAQVKELRERTGSGMMECKKALVEAQGDIEQAIENMRKAGQAKAVKKASRVAAEGQVMVLVAADHRTAVLVEVNSETDFVARETAFKEFAKQVAVQIAEQGTTDLEALKTRPVSASDATTIEEARLNLIGKLGENVHLRRAYLQSSENGTVNAYGHTDVSGMTRIGALVELDIDNPELAYDLAMHVAAMNPEVISEADVPAERIEKEREIVRTQTAEQHQGKGPDMIDKIVHGRMQKFANEISLLGQAFVKNPDEKISNLLNKHKARVVSFKRFEVGEGIEKKEDNFVQDVMAQVRGDS